MIIYTTLAYFNWVTVIARDLMSALYHRFADLHARSHRGSQPEAQLVLLNTSTAVIIIRLMIMENIHRTLIIVFYCQFTPRAHADHSAVCDWQCLWVISIHRPHNIGPILTRLLCTSA